MFTIKNITAPEPVDPNTPGDPSIISGERITRLWEAVSVHCETRIYQNDGEPASFVPTVIFTMPDETTCSIDSGIVYVMNAAGKTVDTFRLRNSHML